MIENYKLMYLLSSITLFCYISFYYSEMSMNYYSKSKNPDTDLPFSTIAFILIIISPLVWLDIIYKKN